MTPARKLDVVVVSAEAPAPFGNAVGRWYYVLAKGLVSRGHRVRWLAASSNERHAEEARARFSSSEIDLRMYSYPSRSRLGSKWRTILRPYSYFISDRLAQDLKTELQKGYDVLDLQHTWAGWLGIGVQRAILSVLALATIDLPSASSNSPLGALNGARMRWTERHLISRFDTIRVLTPRDALVVNQLNGRARVLTVPLAIDPALYPFRVDDPPEPRVGLIGSMEWQPTRSAAIRLLTSIWPMVRTNKRDAKLLIVGWGARKSLAGFLNLPDVTILENVPETETHFRQLSVLAFPVIAGSGMKVKVLEAMAYGVPVVTTSEGIAGIDAEDGVHAFLSDDDKGLASKIVSLLNTGETRRDMRLAARRLLEERYSPGPIISQMESLYAAVREMRS